MKCKTKQRELEYFQYGTDDTPNWFYKSVYIYDDDKEKLNSLEYPETLYLDIETSRSVDVDDFVVFDCLSIDGNWQGEYDIDDVLMFSKNQFLDRYEIENTTPGELRMINRDRLLTLLSTMTSPIAIAEMLEDYDSESLSFVHLVDVITQLTRIDQDCILACINWLIADDRFSTRQDIKKLWELCANDTKK